MRHAYHTYPLLILALLMQLPAADPAPATRADYELAVTTTLASMKWLEPQQRDEMQRHASGLIQRFFPSDGASNENGVKFANFRDHLSVYVSSADLGIDPNPQVKRKEKIAYLQAQLSSGIATHLSVKLRNKDDIARRSARLVGLTKIYAGRLREVLPGLTEVAAEVPERVARERLNTLSLSLGDYFQILGALIDDRSITEQEKGVLPEVPLRFTALIQQWWKKHADPALPTDDRIMAREQYVMMATQEAGWQCDGFTAALVQQEEAAAAAAVVGVSLGELRQLGEARNEALMTLAAPAGRAQPRR